MATVQELLAQSKALLSSSKFKPNRKKQEKLEPYVEPPVLKYLHGKAFRVLAPVGFEWKDTIQSIYLQEMNVQVTWFATVIVHGHSKGVGCSLPAQCHVLGWRPTDDFPKEFLENWKRFGYESI